MSATESTHRVIGDQISFVQRQADAWKPAHRQAMKCYDLEAILGVLLSVYENVRRADHRWSQSARARPSSYDAVGAQQVGALYASWERVAATVFEKVKQFEGGRYQVEGADAFRKALRHARSVQGTAPDRMHAAGEAIAQRRHAGGQTLAQLRAALRLDRRPGVA